MIVISNSIVLNEDEATAGVNANNPRIGWHNIVTETNVAADEEASGFPVVNLSDPDTYKRWKGETTAAQAVTVTLGAAEVVNYFGIVGHNFGSTGATIKLQGSSDSSSWVDITNEQLLADDFAFMSEFADATYRYYRLYITPGSAAPQLAVLYIGRVLRMQRRIYVGVQPPTLNRTSENSSGFSESGQFLGRVRRSTRLEHAPEFQNITPSWYRNYFMPFVEASESLPFFYAWRPGSYPDEVAFCWHMKDPEGTNQRPNGMMSVQMNMQGIR